MFTKMYPNFSTLTKALARGLFDYGKIQSTEKWQGTKAPAPFLELINLSFQVPMEGFNEEEGTKHSVPWADIHMAERLKGLPLNPGESYKQWPYYGQDDKMRPGGQFSHTYMERFWPRYAGRFPSDEVYLKKYVSLGVEEWMVPTILDVEENKGIRYTLGDLQDVVNLLKNEPTTRQAYLPIWFPEDTGANHKGRVPCSIGYHFQIRENLLYVTYQLRSCDFLRHFQDDMYMACYLAQEVLTILNDGMSTGYDFRLGMLNVTICNLHIFANEKNLLPKF